MRLSKKKREEVKKKFNGRCAYTGTILKDDWQVDHIIPQRRAMLTGEIEEINHIDNLFPCQKIVNHYKRAMSLDKFRNWLLGELHLRLAKLPKNPKAEKSVRRKKYLLEIAELFDIREDKPFDKVFYFEKIGK